MRLLSHSLVIILSSTASLVQAQYFQFSQYNFTKQRINPALVASSDYASVSLDYRHQPTAGGFNLNSNFLDVSYPIIAGNGKRWSGIGLSFMDDRAGQQALFQTQETGLTYAINVTLAKRQMLSLGAKVLYQSKQLNLDGLFTGSQFIPDRGFDNSIFNGEGNTSTLRTNHVSFNLGLYWQQIDRRGNRLSYFGLSFFDFNKPTDSFLEETNTLNNTVVGTGGFRVYKKRNVSIIPEILYTLNSNAAVINIGVVTRYDLTSKSKGFIDHVNFITKTIPGRSVIAGVQLQRETLALGLSYDFPAGKGSVANTGAIEIGLELRRLVISKTKRKTEAKKKNSKPAPRVVASKQGELTKTETDSVVQSTIKTTGEKSVQGQVETMSTRLKHKQDSLAALAHTGSLKHEPYIVEKTTLHFNFEFNSADLDNESAQYLEDLSKALMDNPQLKIKLVGHTDNVGSDKFNLKLSVYRAGAIKDFIVEKGISANRIIADGKGMREPLNTNKTEEERAMNRRVELTIMYEE